MFHWLLRHLVMLLLFGFVVSGVVFYDELFSQASINRVLALFDTLKTEPVVVVQPVPAVVQPEPEPAQETVLAESGKPAIQSVPQETVVETQEYNFRPLENPVSDVQYELPAKEILQQDDAGHGQQDSAEAATPVLSPSAVVNSEVQPATEVQNPAVEQPVTTGQTDGVASQASPDVSPQEHATTEQALAGSVSPLWSVRPPVLPQPDMQQPVAIESESSSVKATASFTYTQELDSALKQDFEHEKKLNSLQRYIPNSYTVQPPELLRSPSANYPLDAAQQLISVLPPTLSDSAQDSSVPEIALPSVLPRQEMLSHSLLDPAQHPAEQPGVESVQNQTTQMLLRMNEARTAFWEKDYTKAEKLYIQLIQQFPQSGELFGELGNVYYYQGQSERASIVYTESIVRLVQENKIQNAKFTLDVLWRIDAGRAQQLVELMPGLLDP